MENKITGLINDIKGKTGIDITVYNTVGKKIAYTSAAFSHAFPGILSEKFKDGIYADTVNDICCFLFNTNYNIFMGVISGSGATAKNYAFMLSSMMENALLHSEDNLSRQESLKQLLMGETSQSKAQKLVRKYSSFNSPCYVLSIVCESEKIAEVFDFLEQLAGDTGDTAVLTDDDMIAYLRIIEGESDYQSALDFAEMVLENIEQELSIKVRIGVGSYAKNALELANAFSQAGSAVRMGIMTGGKNSIFSYKEFIMMRMIEDIPKSTLNKYLEVLIDSGAKDILNDSDMLETAEEFLANSLNISETSRILYMHRNTLMYRLDKIEKAMGLNIRRFSDAVTFRIILLLYKHLKY